MKTVEGHRVVASREWRQREGTVSAKEKKRKEGQLEGKGIS